MDNLISLNFEKYNFLELSLKNRNFHEIKTSKKSKVINHNVTLQIQRKLERVRTHRLVIIL